MKKKINVFSIDPTVTANHLLGEFYEWSKISIQVYWIGLTAAVSVDVILQIQQSNGTTYFDDIDTLVWNVTNATDSVTFEHTAFTSGELRLAVTSGDCTGGTMMVKIIAS